MQEHFGQEEQRTEQVRWVAVTSTLARDILAGSSWQYTFPWLMSHHAGMNTTEQTSPSPLHSQVDDRDKTNVAPVSRDEHAKVASNVNRVENGASFLIVTDRLLKPKQLSCS